MMRFAEMQRKIASRNAGTNLPSIALAARLGRKNRDVPSSVAAHENVLFIAVKMA
jgi:hypothetical protein